MSGPVVALAVVAGGLGAALRHLVDTGVRRRGGTGPAAVLGINVSGSLLLGALVGAAVALAGGEGRDAAVVVVLGSGLLGGYTTFSTAVADLVPMLEQRRWRAAALHGPGMLVLALAAAALGWACGAGLASA